MSSKHHHKLSQEVEDVKEKEGDEEEAKEEEHDKEELWDECEGGYPDLEYPLPPVLEEQVPDDLLIKKIKRRLRMNGSATSVVSHHVISYSGKKS
jgi:hypothetical protein